ncbi:hypothetical protein L7F22_058068 [Adiantum nelumboides]|nr:hypothetical protein [Adiantum nelumboides]
MAIGQIINDRRSARRTDGGGAGRNEDMLGVLLSMADDPNSEYVLTDKTEMYAAGTDTSSTVIEWAMAEMIMNPRIMRRVQEEIDVQVGKNRLVGVEDLPHLPLVVATLKETLRLHPVAPLLVPRQSEEACQIDGNNIPAKTNAVINAWRIHRDPSVWEEPLRFWPDRFLDPAKVDLHAKRLEFLPFGAGHRICAGLHLANVITQLSLASLLHCFHWEGPPSPEGSKAGLDMSETYHLTMAMSCPLTAKATPRLPVDVLASMLEV